MSYGGSGALSIADVTMMKKIQEITSGGIILSFEVYFKLLLVNFPEKKTGTSLKMEKSRIYSKGISHMLKRNDVQVKRFCE